MNLKIGQKNNWSEEQNKIPLGGKSLNVLSVVAYSEDF